MHHILEAVHKEGDDGAARPEEEAEHQRYDVGHGAVLVLHVGGDLGKGGGGGGGGSMDGSRSCGILLKVASKPCLLPGFEILMGTTSLNKHAMFCFVFLLVKSLSTKQEVLLRGACVAAIPPIL